MITDLELICNFVITFFLFLGNVLLSKVSLTVRYHTLGLRWRANNLGAAMQTNLTSDNNLANAADLHQVNVYFEAMI